jgi:hypothetical protein
MNEDFKDTSWDIKRHGDGRCQCDVKPGGMQRLFWMPLLLQRMYTWWSNIVLHGYPSIKKPLNPDPLLQSGSTI